MSRTINRKGRRAESSNSSKWKCPLPARTKFASSESNRHQPCRSMWRNDRYVESPLFRRVSDMMLPVLSMPWAKMSPILP